MVTWSEDFGYLYSVVFSTTSARFPSVMAQFKVYRKKIKNIEKTLDFKAQPTRRVAGDNRC